jgi:hypothetical protein
MGENIMESLSTTIYLVSCVGKKKLQTCAARELYVSSWFLKARRYVEESGCRWFILSAEYGIVAPDQLIDPYERTLNRMPLAERRIWADHVYEQLISIVPELSHVVFLAGERYREFLVRHLTDHKITLSVPMEGLTIGRQLSWLNSHSLGK